MDDPAGDLVRSPVPEDLDGVRADRVVAVLFDLPRATARRLVDTAAVSVDGAPVTATARLAAGSVVEATVPESPPAVSPQPVDFEIRYEDDSMVVVDKPAGVVVHPGAGTAGHATLVSGLVYRFPELADMEGSRWGLVHRLDRHTSGLLVVARTPQVHADLQEALRRRLITRRYLAMVLGVPEGARGTVDAPLARDPNHPTRRMVAQGGRPARTHYRRRATWGDVSLLDVTLETGRTHQIRVHMASIGHPVIGDTVYGRRRRPPGAAVADPGRQWLHAASLTLDHPVDHHRVEVEAPLPAELAATLDALGPEEAGAAGR